MAEKPKNRTELIKMLPGERIHADFLIGMIEFLGLRIVPVEPTEEMLRAMVRAEDKPPNGFGLYPAMYSAAIAASPFSPEAQT